MPADRRGRAKVALLAGALAVAALLAALLLIPRAPEEKDDLVAWLEERSMLHQARQASLDVSGHGVQWRHPYGEPRPRDAVERASVWLLDYPGSVVTRPGRSVIATWADPELWAALRRLHVDLLHTGPVNRAGGVEGRRFTPTIDGWFDRISLDLDPALGTEQEYARLVASADEVGGSVAGDLVPLHTGTGPDFWLALRAYKDYPGAYSMVEIDRRHWGLLPEVRDEWGFAHVPRDAAVRLAREGYVPGPINSNDASPEARSWSGWSASGEVEGVDGKVRRWVYLHYFKAAQPALNWGDPSFAAQRMQAGDVVRTVLKRRTRVVRLDAVPFLGIEGKKGGTETLHYQHPLSVTGTNYLAFLIRKLGGHSFHELNVPLSSLKDYVRDGPDLSYDFVTRAQVLHALLASDAGPLRLAFRWLLEAGLQPLAFVHDLQNHDEITYQLVEPEHRKDQTFEVGGKKMTGGQMREAMLALMREKVAGDAAPYNRLYRPQKDGVATTFVGFVAPALGVRDPYHATDADVRLIRRGHLLLAAANALMPGVFSLSSWDLVGALPIDPAAVQQRTSDGDWRWINRGGVDLMGADPGAKGSAFGLPKAKALYGSLPEQRKDPESFASRLGEMLAARKKARLAEGELLAVPEPRANEACVLVMRTPEHALAVTVLNFGREELSEEIDLTDVAKKAGADVNGGAWSDLLTAGEVGPAKAGRLRVRLPALTGTTFGLRKAN
jgi:maltose alpha-D-glucosyltransferase/alpha-amylase